MLSTMRSYTSMTSTANCLPFRQTPRQCSTQKHLRRSNTPRPTRARDASELVSLYAALLSHGTDLDAKSVAAVIQELDPAHISTTMDSLELPGRLPRANERVVEFQRAHRTLRDWEEGFQRFHEPGHVAVRILCASL